MIELRDYQRDAIQALRDKLQTGIKSIVLVLPTGAGKTVVAAHIMHGALRNGSKLLFVAHRRELIAQTYHKMIDMDVPDKELGIIMGDGKIRLKNNHLIKAANPKAPIQIASIDTLRHRDIPEADIVFIDECHRCLSKSYLNLKVQYPDAIHVGLTATPFRIGGKGLGSYYEALHVGAVPSMLISQGFIVSPRVWTVPPDELPDLSTVKTQNGDYKEDDLAKVCNTRKLVGSIVEHWKSHAENRRTVCFPVNIEHSHSIVKDFREAGIPAEHVDGTTPVEKRDAILARLERGEISVVSSVGCLSEGWDQPSVKCCVLARPTKSTGLFLQQAGRILRPWNGIGAIILDHAGAVLEHGSPSEDREFTLEDTKVRKGTLSTKTCMSCYAVVETFHKECPACGEEFKTKEREGGQAGYEHVEGTLIEYSDEVKEKERRGYWDQLCALSDEHNYKIGWAKHRFKDRFGFFPPKSYPVPIGRPMTEGEKDILRAKLERVAAKRRMPQEWVNRKVEEKARVARPPTIPDNLLPLPVAPTRQTESLFATKEAPALLEPAPELEKPVPPKNPGELVKWDL